MIKLIDILFEDLDISSYLSKWVGTQYMNSFPNAVFNILKKKHPNFIRNGKIYRGIEISLDTFKEITDELEIVKDPNSGFEYEDYKVLDNFDKKIRRYIFDREKKKYKSWSTDLGGVYNFISILFNSGRFGYNGNPEVVIISQKSEYLDLSKLLMFYNLKQELKEVNETNEVISIIEPNFVIEGISLRQNSMIPYKGNIDKIYNKLK